MTEFLVGICHELIGPPTQVIPLGSLCCHKWSPRTSYERHIWSTTVVSGPPLHMHYYYKVGHCACFLIACKVNTPKLCRHVSVARDGQEVL